MRCCEYAWVLGRDLQYKVDLTLRIVSLFCVIFHAVFPCWQDFRIGLEALADPAQTKVKLSNVPSSSTASLG